MTQPQWQLLVAGELLVLLVLAALVWSATPPGPGAAEHVTAPATEPTASAPAVSATLPGPAVDLQGSRAALARAPVAAGLVAGDPVGILLRGTLRSSDGRPVAKPSIYLRPERGRGRPASAGAEGHWAVAGLQPGSCTITVRAEGFAPLEQPHLLTEEAVQSVDLVVRPAHPVRVRIETPEGKDANEEARTRFDLFHGFYVVATKDPVPALLPVTDFSIVSFGDAQWRRAEPPKDGVAGTLFLAEPPPAHAAVLLRHVVLAQQRIEPGQDEVRFVVDLDELAARMATVSMRLLDAATGAPLAGATGTLRSTSGGGAHGTADADGRMTIAGALPGLLILELQAKDHESVTTTIRADAGERRDLGELRLGGVVSLRGRVLDAGGKPVPASLQWTELKWRKEPRSFVDHRSAGCDADGTFHLRTGSGPVALTASMPDGRIAVGVFDAPTETPVELRLAPAAPVTFHLPRDPAQSFTVTVFDAQRRPVAAKRVESRWPRYEPKLPAGQYQYEVHDGDDRLVRSGRLTLGTVPVTVQL